MLAVLDNAGAKQQLELMRGLCRAVEHDLGVETPEAARVSPVVLRQLFDGHVLEKSGLELWSADSGARVLSEPVRTACKPLFEWLATAKQEVAEPQED
jgi:hypothetical protein